MSMQFGSATEFSNMCGVTLMNTPIEVSTAFAISVGSTLVALFCAGSAKTWMTGRRWLRSGLETMLIGAIAAAATFLAGRLIAA